MMDNNNKPDIQEMQEAQLQEDAAKLHAELEQFVLLVAKRADFSLPEIAWGQGVIDRLKAFIERFL